MKSSILSVVFAICFLADASVAQVSSPALALHPDNHRYFLFRGEPTVLITSGEHYGLLMNREFDLEAYFAELHSHGLNLTRVFSGAYREIEGSFGITDNPLAPDNANYICPWQRTAETNSDGSPRFDLTTWDAAYFERLKHLLETASRHEVIVELCLFSPMYKPNLWDVSPMNIRNNINGVGDVDSTHVYTTDHADLLEVQLQLAEKLLQFIQPYDNVYVEVCNEPYFGGVIDAWQTAILDRLQQVQRDHQDPHLISINVANKTAKIEDPHPAVSIFNFHYCNPPIVVQQNANIDGVIGENETGFRGSPNLLYRSEAWAFMLAGGGLFNNLDYSFTADHPAGTLEKYSSPGGGNRKFRKQLGILKTAMQRLPLPNIAPRPADEFKVKGDYVTAAIGAEGESYLVYVHVKLPNKLTEDELEPYRKINTDIALDMNLPRGSYRVEQLDVKTGDTVTTSTLEISADTTATVKLEPFMSDTAIFVSASDSLDLKQIRQR